MTMALRADGPIGFRRAARQFLGEGFDFVKMYGSGSLLFASKEPSYPVLEADEIREAVRVADLTGSYIAIHAHGSSAIDEIMRNPTSYNGQRMHKLFPTILSSLQNAYGHRDKILIGWGTDVPLETFMEDPMLEFKPRKEALEYFNEDILEQATINSVRLMGLDDLIGTVK